MDKYKNWKTDDIMSELEMVIAVQLPLECWMSLKNVPFWAGFIRERLDEGYNEMFGYTKEQGTAMLDELLCRAAA